MFRIQRIGHVVLRTADIDAAKAFYTQVLGFEVVEEDPEHGGTFLSLGDQGHDLDLMPAAAADAGPAMDRGVHHIAFRVASFDELKSAHAHLREQGVTVDAALDHVTQQSVYFRDPDGYLLEIYYELPDALARIRDGREDRDTPLHFE